MNRPRWRHNPERVPLTFGPRSRGRTIRPQVASGGSSSAKRRQSSRSNGGQTHPWHSPGMRWGIPGFDPRPNGNSTSWRLAIMKALLLHVQHSAPASVAPGRERRRRDRAGGRHATFGLAEGRRIRSGGARFPRPSLAALTRPRHRVSTTASRAASPFNTAPQSRGTLSWQGPSLRRPSSPRSPRRLPPSKRSRASALRSGRPPSRITS
jgi:hypothetical protein